MPYIATVNVPGYLPMDDDPPIFGTAQEAWDYLAGQCERGEDDMDDEENYSDTRDTLAVLGTAAHWCAWGGMPVTSLAEWLSTFGIAPDGTGTVYGPTPGYEGSHDLGLAYCVTYVEETPESL